MGKKAILTVAGFLMAGWGLAFMAKKLVDQAGPGISQNSELGGLFLGLGIAVVLIGRSE